MKVEKQKVKVKIKTSSSIIDDWIYTRPAYAG